MLRYTRITKKSKKKKEKGGNRIEKELQQISKGSKRAVLRTEGEEEDKLPDEKKKKKDNVQEDSPQCHRN